MSTLIKGMEMPKNCFECPWRCKVDPENLLCRISGEYFEETFSGTIQNRHKSCPLVPVPPHGRLGDLDALYEKFARLESEAMNALKTTNTGSVNWIKWSAILTERTGYKHDIADAPTIIPAEEGE